MVLVYYVVNLMVPQDRYFIEMSTLLNYFRLKDDLPNLTVIQPLAISSQVISSPNSGQTLLAQALINLRL